MIPAVVRHTFAPLTAVLAVLSLSCSQSTEPIRIGLAGPFSNSVGEPMRQAAELAVQEINAAGGIKGRPIELVARDDYGHPDSAIVLAGELDRAGVVAVVGHVNSGASLAAAPVYNRASDPIPQITPSSTAPAITDAGPYTFRMCPSDLAYGAALARFARERLGYERGAVLYLNNEYGRGIRRTFIEEFERQGGRVTEADPYLGDTPAVGPYLERIGQRGDAQFVMVAGNQREAEEALRAARGRGLKLPFMGGDGLEGIEDAGALAEGTYITLGYLPSVDTERNRRFTGKWAQRYGTAQPSQAGAATYYAISLLRDVIGRLGTARGAIRDGLAAVGQTEPAFEGVTGTIAFDQNGDVPDIQVIIGVVRNGRLEPAVMP